MDVLFKELSVPEDSKFRYVATRKRETPFDDYQRGQPLRCQTMYIQPVPKSRRVDRQVDKDWLC
ncbi:hypothetical protein PGT21_004663 [Puccinia graminis f. sp. tritici]|uniref:Uncharacterized protein n=1 Tax=Puccinia graminis f. sp. tritici TaxID=56615 RepID=A0A5B0PHB5_PUCGR|nr:hypothetical protein PGT21_004663 [Puccinia graminis f. sp. tritici]